MLVLSRQPGESIRIGDDIMIHIVESRQGSIRIGVEAPADVKIVREELIQTVGAENRLAVVPDDRARKAAIEAIVQASRGAKSDSRGIVVS